MNRTQLATIISAMHRPVGGVLPAILQPSKPKKITKTTRSRVCPIAFSGDPGNNGQAIPQQNPKR